LDAPLWVALAIVQSYNPSRKFPRSEISMPDLELCLSKAAFSAAQHSGSVPFWFLGIKLLRNLEHIFELSKHHPNSSQFMPVVNTLISSSNIYMLNIQFDLNVRNHR
jgi:hypothetical protein